MNIEELINAAMPHPDDCRRKADELRATYPGLSPEALADRAITTAKRWAAVYGAGSGLASNPFAMVPAAMADMGLTMRTEAHLVGVVGALLDPPSLKDVEGFRGDILAVMFPRAVSQALREVAVQAGKATTRTLVRKYISKGVLRAIISFAAKYLGVKLTQRAILSKTVPLVGGAIGAAWNWVDVERCGRRAIAYHCDEALKG